MHRTTLVTTENASKGPGQSFKGEARSVVDAPPIPFDLRLGVRHAGVWVRALNTRFLRLALLLALGAASVRCSSTQADAGADVEAGSRTDASLADAAAPTDASREVEVGPAVDASDGGTTLDASTASPAGDGAVSPVPPAPAAAAGFTHLVFEDDFTTNDTIAPHKMRRLVTSGTGRSTSRSANAVDRAHDGDRRERGDAGAGNNASAAGEFSP